MPPERALMLVGGGEHARVVAEAARSRPGAWRVATVVDPRLRKMDEVALGACYLSSDEEAATRVGPAQLVLGIGGLDSLALRLRLAALYDAAGATWATVVHAAAWISPSAQLGPGAVVLAGAVVNTGSRIGAHAIVNTGAIIEHDVQVGDFAFIGPGVVVGGGVIVGSEAYLGLGCRVRDHIEIGPRALVAMGAVVVQSVPAGMRVMGVPARARGEAGTEGS